MDSIELAAFIIMAVLFIGLFTLVFMLFRDYYRERAGKEEWSRFLSNLKELHSVNSIIDNVRSLPKYCYRNEHIDTRNTWYKSQTV